QLHWPGASPASPAGLAAPAAPSRRPLVLARGATPGTPMALLPLPRATGRSRGRPAGAPPAAPGQRARRAPAVRAGRRLVGGHGWGGGGTGVVVGGAGRGLARAQVQFEPRIQRRGQAGERAQGEVLAPRQHLADPSGGDAHAAGQVSTGEVPLVQVPVDFVRGPRYELRQFFLYLGLGGLLAGRLA